MNCYQHDSRSATAECVGCQQPICQDCTEEVAGHAMCRSCITTAEARLSQPSAPWLTPAGGPTPALATGEATPATAGVVVAEPEASLEPEGDLDAGQSPGILRRLGRGWFWGLCYGQWWTLMVVASGFLWGHGWPGGTAVLIMAFWYGFFGSLAGLLIGAANASLTSGPAIGVGAGIVVCLLEAALARSASSLINLVFFFFTGRFVGASITWRVQQPVPSPSVNRQ